jgi:hypothetical protein
VIVCDTSGLRVARSTAHQVSACPAGSTVDSQDSGLRSEQGNAEPNAGQSHRTNIISHTREDRQLALLNG